MARPKDHIQHIYRSRKVFHLYQIEDRVEAGVVLTGSEVKSLREARGNLADAHVVFRKGEAWLVNAHVGLYPQANRQNHEPTRDRKLLLSKRELRKLAIRVRERGYSLVPIAMYFRGAWVKIELGLGRGKKKHDKRSAIKERQDKRDMDRATRGR